MAIEHQDKLLQAKKAVGHAAAEMVEDGMRLGLGTGSTAKEFIACLIERCRQGLKIEAIATSRRSEEQARQGGIPILSSDEVTALDITFDGADEVDTHKRLIKGGGGALLREKIVASMSQEMVVLVDQSKCVKQFGRFPLPIEIVPFAYRATVEKIGRIGYRGTLRRKSNKELYVTDGGHYIYDINLPIDREPEEIQRELLSIPGVIETGFFLNLAGRVLVGCEDGSVKILA